MTCGGRGRGARSGLTAAFASAVLLASGCGGPSGSSPPDYAEALRGAPAPLARLHDEANRLLPGGREAFEQRLRALRGYPVVANIWSSWCGSCLYEFPMLQEVSARFGTRVAFLGIDSEDSPDAAGSWLAKAPVPYPSFSDPEAALKDAYGATGLPATAFFDRSGQLIWLKQGAYRDATDLEADIQRLAL